jgi:hypothetical protein
LYLSCNAGDLCNGSGNGSKIERHISIDDWIFHHRHHYWFATRKAFHHVEAHANTGRHHGHLRRPSDCTGHLQAPNLQFRQKACGTGGQRANPQVPQLAIIQCFKYPFGTYRQVQGERRHDQHHNNKETAIKQQPQQPAQRGQKKAQHDRGDPFDWI